MLLIRKLPKRFSPLKQVPQVWSPSIWWHMNKGRRVHSSGQLGHSNKFFDVILTGWVVVQECVELKWGFRMLFWAGDVFRQRPLLTEVSGGQWEIREVGLTSARVKMVMVGILLSLLLMLECFDAETASNPKVSRESSRCGKDPQRCNQRWHTGRMQTHNQVRITYCVCDTTLVYLCRVKLWTCGNTTSNHFHDRYIN